MNAMRYNFQVGDWCYSTFSEKPCRILSISEDNGGYYSVIVDKVIGRKDIVSISPIPFTYEILNGNFKWSQYRMFWCCEEDDRLRIEERGDVWYLDFNDWEASNHLSYHFEYTHQLQNILRDLQIDKEIIL